MANVRYHSTAAALLDDASKVHPYEQNPRNGDTDAIVDSIRENGCYRPIYAWAHDGTILAGNHTYAALLELGEERIPIAWVEAADLAAARKIVLADNRTADLGRYDDALLLQELQALDGDLLGTGYTPDAVEDLERYLEHLAMADAANAGDLGEDPDDRIDLDAGQVRLTVIIDGDHREEFYAAMADLDYVVDTRDAAT
jgi:hypothetical protein